MMSVWMLVLIGCFGDDPVAGHAIGAGDDRPVWMYRLNGVGWERSSVPVAHSVSSLGLGLDGEQLVLSMQCFWGDCGSESKRREIGPPIHAITTTDLLNWKPDMARLVDPEDRVPIDTEVRGDEVWYFGTVAGTMGDPAKHAESHRIYRAQRQEDKLISPELMIEGSGLADPAPLIVGGKQFLFLTTKPGMAIGLARGTPLRVTREWAGVSVPHAMWVGKQIWLWAQTVRNGRMVPVRSISEDLGETWSEWDAPLPMTGLSSCGNPVGVVFDGTPVVFCVTEPLGVIAP
jgi:hypothetical protein